MDLRFRSSLAIGATGMLQEALGFVAQSSDHTWAVSRNAGSFASKHPLARCDWLDIDYRDEAGFWKTIDSHVDLATADLALLWIHDDGEGVLLPLLEKLAKNSMTIVHVVGSSVGNPEAQAQRTRSAISFGEECHYLPVVLGRMEALHGWRWLTDSEICKGTVSAITSGAPQMVGFRTSDL